MVLAKRWAEILTGEAKDVLLCGGMGASAAERFIRDVQIDALESAAARCLALVCDPDRPRLAAGAGQCMLALREMAEELVL